MSNLYVALIVGGCFFLMFLALLSGVVIKCSREIAKAKTKEKYWYDRAEELQRAIEKYGVREINIGEDN